MSITIDLHRAATPIEGARTWVRKKAYRVQEVSRFAYMQRIKGFSVSESPEFDPESLPYFCSRLASAKRYLEFGSGGSTILAARSGVPFTCVESDPYFLSAVKQKISAMGVANATTQRFVYADIGWTEAWGAPVFRTPTTERLGLWRRYPEAPWRESAPDLILVDGRFRVACALAAITHLGESSWELLLDDYVGRDHYRVVERFAVLTRMVGRMAVFTPQTGVDRAALHVALNTAYKDYR